MENTTNALLPNAFALFNGIHSSSSGPDHGESVLTLGPDSLNPYGLLHGGAYYTMNRLPYRWKKLRHPARGPEFHPFRPQRYRDRPGRGPAPGPQYLSG